MTTKLYEYYWRESDPSHFTDFKIKWPKLKPYIEKWKRGTVVDFGCGSGFIIQEMQKINPLAHYIGLDASLSALEAARNKVNGATFFKIVDGERFPLENASVDFVFSSDVIEHVYDTENAISEISRILKSDGILLLTTPYHGLIKNLLIILFKFDEHFNPTWLHIRFFSKKALLRLLTKYGFKIKKFGYYGRFFPVPHSMFVVAEKL